MRSEGDIKAEVEVEVEVKIKDIRKKIKV